MATSREYAEFILAKFARLDDVVSIRPMMGEYVIHMAGKVLGFIADEQLLLQNVPTVVQALPDAERRELFPGSKLFCIVDDGISDYRLCEIARAAYDEFPISKPRKKKGEKACGKGTSVVGSGDVAGTGKGARKVAGETEKPADDGRFSFAKHIKW